MYGYCPLLIRCQLPLAINYFRILFYPVKYGNSKYEEMVSHIMIQRLLVSPFLNYSISISPFSGSVPCPPTHRHWKQKGVLPHILSE
jgi:hypothetical protein